MAEQEKPEISGAVLRSYVEEMRNTGALDDVLARVPADVRSLAQKPPLPISWVDARLTNQLLVALQEARGREAVVELGVNSVPVPEAVYATWEGTFRASFALLNVASPRVAPARLSEGGRRGEVDLSW